MPSIPRAVALGWLCCVACGAASPSGTTPEHSTSLRSARAGSSAGATAPDPIAALAPDASDTVSWVLPGPVVLELGATPISTINAGGPIEVSSIDRVGSLERVAVRLEHARFSLWVDRHQMLAVLKHDQRITASGPPAIGGEIELRLREGAVVQRLAHRDRKTQIRYVGALQVEGWVPDAALADRGRKRDNVGRFPTGRRTVLVLPGAVVRGAPRWAAGELARVANGYALDAIRDVDDAWSEVGYEDGDVVLRGFVSRRDPPGRLYRWPEPETAVALAPSGNVASGTCLYARPDGDAIGYVVGNRAVELEEARAGWWTLTLDTPWGPIGFAAQGATRSELAACAPEGSVPPPAPVP